MAIRKLLVGVVVVVGAVWVLINHFATRSHSVNETPKIKRGSAGRVSAGPGTVLITAGPPLTWPPRMGTAFPDFPVLSEGKVTTLLNVLKTFGAKVVLVEPVGLSCSGCHAFAGAHQKGLFRNFKPQSDLDSIENYFATYARTKMVRSEVVLVQLLLYSENMGPTSLKDGEEWARHFDLGFGKQHVVIAMGTEYQNRASRNSIPGFYLLDSTLKVVSESVGYQPKHNLYTELLPHAGRLLGGH